MELQELKMHQLRNEEYKPLAAIERINLCNCEVESIFQYQTRIGDQTPKFQYLKMLTLKECARLKFVFFAPICQGLPELSDVSISDCEELEAIFLGNEESDENASITEACLLKLRSLEIKKCNKLKFILSFITNNATTSMLPQLSTLTISDSSQLEEVFRCFNIEDYDIDGEREIVFPSLKDITLGKLPRLVNVCKGFKMHLGASCTVGLYDCPKFMSIMRATIDWNEKRIERKCVLRYSQLNNNEALNLPLSILVTRKKLVIQSSAVVEDTFAVIGDDDQEEIENSEMLKSEQQMLRGLVPTQVLIFQYLHSLEMIQCKKLKFLFLVSTIVNNSLPNLSSLILSDCEELEVIFGHSNEDNANCSEKIVLSTLRKIKLQNLPNFINVCQGMQIQVQLDDIRIWNCPKFLDSSLGSALQQMETISFPQASIENSGFQTATDVKRQLSINKEKGMILTSRVEHLSLKDSESLMYLWEGSTVISFQTLKQLFVNGCKKLKCIFPSTVIKSLPCLWYLHIEGCEELEEIMSSEPLFPNASSSSFCFPKLQSLDVIKCRKLKWLFPSLPSTQHLPLLGHLTIKHCCQVEGLFKCEVEIQEEGFYNNLLPKLPYLIVDDCPMFSETTLAALQSSTRRW
ncbi:uncharacterized protein LOC129318401 isoform X2 [Prosopis cineraria]|uniref:uncharacterized protein LOC129318401 isoform X2 n=1 Tax=Prosopis cineraria TaxID=364024 RepID=UPI00240F413A|nr:uncharacterized protein LOC129318401 isoform X2 [Prosopis cineraria]